MNTFRFSIPLTVRINDLNYGGHVGYQNFFSFFQEARVAYLKQFGYSEMDIEGKGMIIGEANCKYRRELFLDDQIRVACAITEFKSKAFSMVYEISKEDRICASGYTRNLCFDYQTKKVIRPPETFVQAISAYENL